MCTLSLFSSNTTFKSYIYGAQTKKIRMTETRNGENLNPQVEAELRQAHQVKLSLGISACCKDVLYSTSCPIPCSCTLEAVGRQIKYWNFFSI